MFRNMSATPVNRKHHLLLLVLRALQFSACITMLILFSIRLGRINNAISFVSAAVGAVEGILAAATVYTFIALILQGIKRTTSKLIRLAFAILDICFVLAFIAVAVLTSPENYSNAYSCLGSNTINTNTSFFNYCSLPWGPFILGILSTISFAITALLHGGGGENRFARNEKVAVSGPIDGPVAPVSTVPVTGAPATTAPVAGAPVRTEI